MSPIQAVNTSNTEHFDYWHDMQKIVEYNVHLFPEIGKVFFIVALSNSNKSVCEHSLHCGCVYWPCNLLDVIVICCSILIGWVAVLLMCTSVQVGIITYHIHTYSVIVVF